MDIGEVSRRSGLAPTTLHLWEKQGLVESTGRHGLRRQYDEDILERLAIIVVCQEVGFTLKQIRALLEPGALAASRVCLEDKRRELLEQRARIDRAIDGLGHAIECTHATPLECPNFLSKLDGVLPVPRKAPRQEVD